MPQTFRRVRTHPGRATGRDLKICFCASSFWCRLGGSTDSMLVIFWYSNYWSNFIRTSIYHKCSGLMKKSTHLDQISYCKYKFWFTLVEQMDLPSIGHKYSPRSNCRCRCRLDGSRSSLPGIFWWSNWSHWMVKFITVADAVQVVPEAACRSHFDGQISSGRVFVISMWD